MAKVPSVGRRRQKHAGKRKQVASCKLQVVLADKEDEQEDVQWSNFVTRVLTIVSTCSFACPVMSVSGVSITCTL